MFKVQVLLDITRTLCSNRLYSYSQMRSSEPLKNYVGERTP